MSKKILLITVVIIIAGISAYYFWVNNDKQAGQNLNNSINQNTQMENKILENGLQIIDEAVGTGAEAKTGDIVSVNYLGTFQDGKKFDSSYDRNQPFSFALGAGSVIQGWDIGVVGMKVGGKRKLVIPPDLAYGSQDYGPIPGNSTLVFEIELLGVTSRL